MEILVPVDRLPVIGPIAHWVPIEVIVKDYSSVLRGVLHVELVHDISRGKCQMSLLEV
jgi:hypothetical protein